MKIKPNRCIIHNNLFFEIKKITKFNYNPLKKFNFYTSSEIETDTTIGNKTVIYLHKVDSINTGPKFLSRFIDKIDHLKEKHGQDFHCDEDPITFEY